MTAEQNPRQTHFGFRDVPEAEKAGMVREVFESVAPKYDLMNDLMSAGVHRLWKTTMVDVLAPRPGQRIVDVAGGTGDIAFRIVARIGAATPVTVCDINPEMIAVGRDRALDRGLVDGVLWSVGDAERLPFPESSFDAFTIAFGLRNVTHLDAALAEARRVLVPGGKFLCLEFSRMTIPGLDRLYDAYSFGVLPWLGQAVAGDAASYRYLAESIRKFPPQEKLVTMMKDAGFGTVTYRNLSGGIAALHCGWRI
ncbi:MAG: bifunctional demethylmenaquinone methyltransferase/2-methoxy-6-polyprenyl-1,4-benzoquinol methylase UbiE [Rhodospirillaceae bacterium]|nr:bifunctional demethylmenaquinone methyltransferase/2-methoxy-6-polyprenyl-1,4-benzoquinol methylase UbiE [Rhodospirillaceae bacterium]